MAILTVGVAVLTAFAAVSSVPDMCGTFSLNEAPYTQIEAEGFDRPSFLPTHIYLTSKITMPDYQNPSISHSLVGYHGTFTQDPTGEVDEIVVLTSEQHDEDGCISMVFVAPSLWDNYTTVMAAVQSWNTRLCTINNEAMFVYDRALTDEANRKPLQLRYMYTFDACGDTTVFKPYAQAINIASTNFNLDFHPTYNDPGTDPNCSSSSINLKDFMQGNGTIFGNEASCVGYYSYYYHGTPLTEYRYTLGCIDDALRSHTFTAVARIIDTLCPLDPAEYHGLTVTSHAFPNNGEHHPYFLDNSERFGYDIVLLNTTCKSIPCQQIYAF